MELNFESGLKTFSINGKCEVSFNPTDLAFSERLFGAFDVLDEHQKAYEEAAQGAADYKSLFEAARKTDKEMREIIDRAFEADVCGPLFGSMNVYAYGDGLPVWANLMLTVMDQIQTSFADEQRRSNSRLDKYLKKYHKQ